MEHAVLYLPSNGTSFICNTTAAAFRLISRFILPWTGRTQSSKILKKVHFILF